jgi:hypothetical protein
LDLLGIPAAAKKSFVARDETIDVYPENWTPLLVFQDMHTQWRPGFHGLVGLDYEALPVVYRARGIARAAQADVFDAVRLMELETLAVWREQAERERKKPANGR